MRPKTCNREYRVKLFAEIQIETRSVNMDVNNNLRKKKRVRKMHMVKRIKVSVWDFVKHSFVINNIILNTLYYEHFYMHGHITVI